jgi:hypothetical protein
LCRHPFKKQENVSKMVLVNSHVYFTLDHVSEIESGVAPYLRELANWKYHGGNTQGDRHTRNEVLLATNQITDLVYGSSEKDFIAHHKYRAQIAALSHDIGLSFGSYDAHEPKGSVLLQKIMQESKLDFGRADLGKISIALGESNILVPAHSTLGKILRDADIAYVGRLGSTAALKRIDDLRDEVRTYHHPFLEEFARDDKTWWALQVSFIENLKWQTPQARELYDPGRIVLLERIKDINAQVQSI